MYEWKLNKKRQGEDGWHPILHSLASCSTPMSYGPEIGFLLLWLALFYHANECWLMVETWLATSQMSTKSLRNLKCILIHAGTKFLLSQPRIDT